jgi:thiol-disulfide isomerase/thioredoxin
MSRSKRHPVLAAVLVSLCLTFMTAPPARAAERMVLAEDFTATWCVYCPDAAHAIEQLMLEYPDTYLGMQIHGDDSYEYAWGTWRRTQFYPGFQGYPTIWTDGVYERVGGGSGVYAALLSHYNARQNVPTDVVLNLGASQINGGTYNVECNVGIEDGGQAKTLRIYIVQVLDNYPVGEEWPHNCFIQAADIDDCTLAAGEFVTVQRQMTFSGASWSNPDDIRLIAWAQDPFNSGPAEIHQVTHSLYPFESLDCNGNGIPDSQDIAEGTSMDCNGNGRPDECDLDEGAAEDCNENGILDICEVSEQGELMSEQLSPFGSGFPQEYTILSPVEQMQDVVLTFFVHGDFSGSSERADLRINGEYVDTVFGGSLEDCADPPAEEQYVIPKSAFNAYVDSGEDVTITLNPTSGVDPYRCDDDTYVQLRVDLTVPGGDNDQNANGIPDDCEEELCPADFDGNGSVDVMDLLTLLGAWGSSNETEDLNGDGIVNVMDLLMLLAAWGDC